MKEFYNEMILLEEDLKKYALYLTRNKEDAKDLLQDTFSRAIRNNHLFKKGTFLKRWLLTIMKNLFLNDIKSKYKYQKSHSDNISYANNHFVNNKVWENLSIDNIESEIEKLNKYQKQVFYLFLKGYKGKEISELVGASPEAVRVHIFFIKNILKEKLKKLGYENSKN